MVCLVGNLEVNYVAENHESLHHILVFLMVSGAVPGVDLEAEVLPSFSGSSDSSNSSGVDTNQGDRLIIKSGVHVSLPVSLPGRTTPGKKEIKVQGEHYEIKLSTTSPNTNHQDSQPLLDATQLNSASPTSFICSSCSLPIVEATSPSSSSSSPALLSYRDLPSEHWEELVDAWMCHADQKLTEQVSKHAKAEKGGFWPRPGQALVGGSYILFREDTIVTGNVHPPQETTVSRDTLLFIQASKIFTPILYFSITGQSRRPKSEIHRYIVAAGRLLYCRSCSKPVAGFGCDLIVSWPSGLLNLLVDTKRPI